MWTVLFSFVQFESYAHKMSKNDATEAKVWFVLTLKVLVATIDALGHFETG